MTVATIGSVGKPFAVHGWQVLISYTNPPEQIISYQPHLLLQKKGVWQKCLFAETEIKQNKLLVRLQGVTTPEYAKQFSQCAIGIERKHLPKLEEDYYWHDLIGMKVIFQSKDRLHNYGIVRSVCSAGTKHDVLEVFGNGKTRLIPFIKNIYISKVDISEKQIWVLWPPDY